MTFERSLLRRLGVAVYLFDPNVRGSCGTVGSHSCLRQTRERVILLE